MILIDVNWDERTVEEGSYISQRYRTPDAQRNKMRQAQSRSLLCWTPQSVSNTLQAHGPPARQPLLSLRGRLKLRTASGGKDFSAGLARVQRCGNFVARRPAQLQSLSVTIAGKVQNCWQPRAPPGALMRCRAATQPMGDWARRIAVGELTSSRLSLLLLPQSPSNNLITHPCSVPKVVIQLVSDATKWMFRFTDRARTHARTCPADLFTTRPSLLAWQWVSVPLFSECINHAVLPLPRINLDHSPSAPRCEATAAARLCRCI